MKPTGKTHKKSKKIKQPSEPRGCVYLLTNLVNGKRYVGQDQTGDPENHRWKQHKTTAIAGKSAYPVHCALRKAHKRDKCWKGFKFEIIWRGPVSQLNWKETYYIKKLHTWINDPDGDRSYNLTKGGDGVRGFKHSKSGKQHMSYSQQRRCAQAGESEARSAARSTPESRERASVAQKRRFADSMRRAEHRAACNTDGARENYSKARLRYFEVPGNREVWNAILLACRQSEEYHAKLCAGQQKRFSNEEHRAAMHAAKQTPTARANYSASATTRWDMTPEERTAYWHSIHPNGNGGGRKRKKQSVSMAAYWKLRTPAERKAHGKASKLGKPKI